MALDPATRLDADPKDLVPTPGNRWVHKSCVHELPDGIHLDQNMDMVDDGTGVVVKRFEACPYKSVMASATVKTGQTSPPATTGWALDDSAFAPMNAWGFNSFNYITSQWLVPSAPSSWNTQLIYIFNSLEDNNGPPNATIMQPVLQWGRYGGTAGAGGGNYYVMANWFGIVGTFFHSTFYTVQPGQRITGLVRTLSCSSGVCNWQVWYNVTNPTTPQSLHTESKTMSHGIKMIRASRGVLERYGLTYCNQYPASHWVQFLWSGVMQPGPTTNDFNYVMPGWVDKKSTVYPADCFYDIESWAGTMGGFDGGVSLYW